MHNYCRCKSRSKSRSELTGFRRRYCIVEKSVIDSLGDKFFDRVNRPETEDHLLEDEWHVLRRPVT